MPTRKPVSSKIPGLRSPHAAVGGIVSAWLIFKPARLVFLGYAVLDPFSSFLSLTLCVGLAMASLSAAPFLHKPGADSKPNTDRKPWRKNTDGTDNSPNTTFQKDPPDEDVEHRRQVDNPVLVELRAKNGDDGCGENGGE